MADRDYTKECDRWNLGADDTDKLVNFVTNLVADHIDHAQAQANTVDSAWIHSHPETDEPSIMIGVGPEGNEDRFFPISEVMYDADPELLAEVTALLRKYCDQ